LLLLVRSGTMLELLLKVALAPGLVVLVTLASRRWGDTIGGIIIAVPIVAGPILLILGVDHGAAFVHRAAQAALLGIVAVGAFCIVCGRALRLGWGVAVGLGWVGYGLITAALAGVQPTMWIGLPAALAAITAARWLIGAPGSDARASADPPSWDLPARAGAAALLVVALTSSSSALGPSVSGLLTPFPVATSVVVAFTLQQSGRDAAIRTLRGYLTGLPGFAAFFVIVALLT
jgi:hypothetical protein